MFQYEQNKLKNCKLHYLKNYSWFDTPDITPPYTRVLSSLDTENTVPHFFLCWLHTTDSSMGCGVLAVAGIFLGN
jgi:hypothetical protein